MKHLPPLTFSTGVSGLLLIAVGVLLAVRPTAESTVWIVEFSRGVVTVPVITLAFVACGGVILWFRPSYKSFARLHTPLVYLLGLNTGFILTTDTRPAWVVSVYIVLLIALMRLRWTETHGIAAPAKHAD